MSSTTSITFECDRCGAKTARPADPRIAEESLPDGWARLDALVPGVHDITIEVCAACFHAWEEWRETPQPGEQPDARRFARWFLEQPYEIRRRFLDEQAKRR